MSARTAEKNNDKLFPLFRRNLTENNVNLYAATAEKLALWAARDKAYYPIARPVIVELLETAHAQVRRHSTTPDKPFHISEYPESLKPWAEPYVKLLRTVEPFFRLFTEPELQARLRALLQTIEVDPLALGYTKRPTQQPSPYAVSPLTDRGTHSASPMSRLSPPSIPVSSISTHSRATPPGPSRAGSGTPVTASSSSHPYGNSSQASGTPPLLLPPLPPPRGNHITSPISIHVPSPSLKMEPQRSPMPIPPGPSTPSMSLSMTNLSIQPTNMSALWVDPNLSAAVASPLSALGASPTNSALSSPAVTAAPPGESASAPLPKRKAKKKRKRLTEDDFIMADLADWESARANKGTPPASPSIPVKDYMSRAGSTSSAQADPQTPREAQGPSASRASSMQAAGTSEAADASISNTTNGPLASSTVKPELATSKQPTPVPAVSAHTTPAQFETVAEAEQVSSTPAPAAARPVNRPVEVDLRSQACSPKTSRKKKASQEFHFLSENGLSPTSMPIKKKKHSPGLMVFRLDSQVSEGRLGSLSANSNTPEPLNVNEKEQAEQQNGNPPYPEPMVADIEMKDRDGELKPASVYTRDPSIPEEASGVLRQQEGQQERPQESMLDGGQLQGTDFGHANDHAPAPKSEDIVMLDHVEESEANQVRSGSQPIEVDSGPSDEVPVVGPADSFAMDVVMEPALDQSEDNGPAAFPPEEPLRPPIGHSRAAVASFEASVHVHGNLRLEGVDHSLAEDINMDVDAQPATDLLQSTMASTSAVPSPTADLPYEDVVQELAEKKGLSSNITSQILNAAAEDRKPEFKLAPAEWTTQTRSSTPSESAIVSRMPSDPIETFEPVVTEPVVAYEPAVTSGPIMPPEPVMPSGPVTDAEPIMPVVSSELVMLPKSHVPRKRSQSPLCSADDTDEGSRGKPKCSSPVPTSPDAVTEHQTSMDPVSTDDNHNPEQIPTEASLMQAHAEKDTPPTNDTVAEPERTSEPPSQPSNDSEAEKVLEEDVYEEDGETSDDVPPVSLSGMPTSSVEEGEIQAPAPLAESSTTHPIPLPLVNLNSPLAYSDIRVLECRRGSSEDGMVFEFNVDPELMASISRWVARYKSTEDVSNDRCVSFSCYPFNDCVDYIRAKSKDADDDSSYEKLCRSVVMKWPKDGRLWAELTNTNGEHSIILSPPFIRKTEQVVDLSDYVTLGTNVLHVYQLRDYSDFVFTLNIHTPVPSQLQELQQRRDHDAHWKSFLHSLTVFELPELPWNKSVTEVKP